MICFSDRGHHYASAWSNGTCPSFQMRKWIRGYFTSSSLWLEYSISFVFVCWPIIQDGLWLPDHQMCCTLGRFKSQHVWVYCFFFFLFFYFCHKTGKLPQSAWVGLLSYRCDFSYVDSKSIVSYKALFIYFLFVASNELAISYLHI